MAKTLTFIGVAAIAIGVLFMGAGFFAGGPLMFLLAAQVGLPAVISGIVFLAFGYVVELLEGISHSLRLAAEKSRDASKASAVTHVRLEELASAVRALRSIGDVNGGLNEKQRSSVVDFVANCNGGELTKDQRQSVGAWVETTSGALEADLASLANASPTMTRRIQSSLSSVVNASGVMHSASDRRTRVETAASKVKAALPEPVA